MLAVCLQQFSSCRSFQSKMQMERFLYLEWHASSSCNQYCYFLEYELIYLCNHFQSIMIQSFNYYSFYHLNDPNLAYSMIMHNGPSFVVHAPNNLITLGWLISFKKLYSDNKSYHSSRLWFGFSIFTATLCSIRDPEKTKLERIELRFFVTGMCN